MGGDGALLYVQLQADTTAINSSHIIHKVSFGPTFPGQVNPLDSAFPPFEDSAVYCNAFLQRLDFHGPSHLDIHACKCLHVAMADVVRILEKESGTFKYFLKVVPTEYVKLDGELTLSHHKKYCLSKYRTGLERQSPKHTALEQAITLLEVDRKRGIQSCRHTYKDIPVFSDRV